MKKSFMGTTKSFLTASLFVGIQTVNFAVAANTTGKAVNGMNNFATSIFQDLISPLIGFFSMVMFVYFIFGVLRFFTSADQNEEARRLLKQHLTWGLVGLFIIFSIGGIVGIITSFTVSK